MKKIKDRENFGIPVVIECNSKILLKEDENSDYIPTFNSNVINNAIDTYKFDAHIQCRDWFEFGEILLILNLLKCNLYGFELNYDSKFDLNDYIKIIRKFFCLNPLKRCDLRIDYREKIYLFYKYRFGDNTGYCIFKFVKELNSFLNQLDLYPKTTKSSFHITVNPVQELLTNEELANEAMNFKTIVRTDRDLSRSYIKNIKSWFNENYHGINLWSLMDEEQDLFKSFQTQDSTQDELKPNPFIKDLFNIFNT